MSKAKKATTIAESIAKFAKDVAASPTLKRDIDEINAVFSGMTRPMPSRSDLDMTPDGMSLPERALLLAIADNVMMLSVAHRIDTMDIERALKHVLKEQDAN